jgi:replicative DNA helicase
MGDATTQYAPVPFDDVPASGPYNLELEQNLIGCLLVDNTLLDRLAHLQPYHFYEALHSRLFERLATLVANDDLASPATMQTYFSDDAPLKQVGGSEYLARLASDVSHPAHALGYAKTIIELWRRRELILAAEQSIQRVLSDVDADAGTIGEDLSDTLHNLSEDDGLVGQHPVLASVAMDETMDRLEAGMKNPDAAMGLRCGISDLDKALGGFQEGRLLIIGGRPSMGKTTLGTAIGRGVAMNNDQQAGVIIFSMEMVQDEIMTRVATEMSFDKASPIAYQDATIGQITAAEFSRLNNTVDMLGGVPFFVDFKAGRSIAGIRGECIRVNRILGQQGKRVRMIVVDQLGHITDTGRYAGRKVDELGELTRGLKKLGKDMDIIVVCLHQLSRGVEGRDNKHPKLSDLRESGHIEEDADDVIFVYRYFYYLERDEPDEATSAYFEWADKMEVFRHKLDVIVAKRRMGGVSTVQLYTNMGSGAILNKAGAE